MKDQELLARITIERSWAVSLLFEEQATVEYILNLLAHGTSEEEIRKEYEGISQEDIQACLIHEKQVYLET